MYMFCGKVLATGYYALIFECQTIWLGILGAPNKPLNQTVCVMHATCYVIYRTIHLTMYLLLVLCMHIGCACVHVQNIQFCVHITLHQLRTRRALLQSKDVPLRTRRELKTVQSLDGDSALLALNRTSLNRNNALLALN